MIAIGIFLIAAYAQIQKGMTDVDVKSTEARSLQGIYTLGVMFLTMGLVLLATSKKIDLLSVESQPTLVMSFAALLGVVLLVLSGILVNKTSGDAKTWSIMTLVASILMLVLASWSLTKRHAPRLLGLADFAYCGL